MKPMDPAVAAASQAAAQAWAAAMQQRRPACSMSPMDEIGWFDAPKLSTVLLAYGAAAATQVAVGNVQRTSITFSLINQGNSFTATADHDPTIMVGPSGNLDSFGIAIPGFAVSRFNPLVIISADQFPGLVQGTWYAYLANVTGFTLPAQYLSVVEMVIRDWPQRKR